MGRLMIYIQGGTQIWIGCEDMLIFALMVYFLRTIQPGFLRKCNLDI